MATLLQNLRTALMLFPIIIEAIRAIEAMMPASGMGATKLALVRDVVQGAWATATDVGTTFEAIWPMLEKMIATVVAAFNKIGSFAR